MLIPKKHDLIRSPQSEQQRLRSLGLCPISRANQEAIKNLEYDLADYITVGSPKQIGWAIAIAAQFLARAHCAGFEYSDLMIGFNQGKLKFAKFWIDNRSKDSRDCGELIEFMEGYLQEVKSESRPIASLSREELQRRVSRL